MTGIAVCVPQKRDLMGQGPPWVLPGSVDLTFFSLLFFSRLSKSVSRVRNCPSNVYAVLSLPVPVGIGGKRRFFSVLV